MAGDSPVRQSMDKFGLPAVWYKVFRDENCNKVICDLVQHNKAAIYASLIKWAPTEDSFPLMSLIGGVG